MGGPFGNFGVGINLDPSTFSRLAFPRSPLADVLSVLASTSEKLSDAAREDRKIAASEARTALRGSKPKQAFDENGDPIEVGSKPDDPLDGVDAPVAESAAVAPVYVKPP